MSGDLLIDGYNLLHAAGWGRAEYAPGELRLAREQLLTLLFEGLTPAQLKHSAVVFDARQPPPDLPRCWYIHGLRVLFASPSGDADVFIEGLIETHAQPRRLTVVSSDRRLQRAARYRHCVVLSSEAFLESLLRRQDKQAPLPDPEKLTPKYLGTPPRDELNYWMRVFQDVSVSTPADKRTDSGRMAPVETKAIRPPVAEVKAPPPSKAARRKLKSPFPPRPPVQSRGNAPPLFSDDWLNDLQRWVDTQQ